MRLAFSFIALFLGFAILPVYAAHTVPHVEDLRAEGVAAQRDGVVLLLMIAGERCHYCRMMEEQFLVPMMISGDYDTKVRIRQVHMGVGGKMRDFDGKTVTVDQWAESRGIRVTPTLLFLDATGQPLTNKMVGLTTPDFFGGYLDEAIDTALERLREQVD